MVATISNENRELTFASRRPNDVPPSTRFGEFLVFVPVSSTLRTPHVPLCVPEGRSVTSGLSGASSAAQSHTTMQRLAGNGSRAGATADRAGDPQPATHNGPAVPAGREWTWTMGEGVLALLRAAWRGG
jgi:hypothetical protein